MGKFVSGSVVLLVSLMLSLLAAEGLVRLIYKDEINLFPRYHTDAVYGDFTLRRMRPDTQFWHTSQDGSWKFRINNKGYRNDQDYDHAKPDGVYRVLVLGDSHTQGYEVRQSQTYSSVMQRKLRRAGLNAEVINTGVSGFSTAEELAYLENEGYKYEPDAVVLGFYANDFQDNLKAGLYKLGPDGSLVVAKTAHIPGVRIQNFIYSLPFVKWLGENSYFYSLLFNVTWEALKAQMTREAEEKATDYAVPTAEEFSDYDYALAGALLERMGGFCEKIGARFIVADIPLIFEAGEVKSSFSGRVDDVARASSDAFVGIDPLFTDYQGVAEIHRPHGHRHINEFSHSLIGVAAAGALLRLEHKPPAAE